MKDSDIFKCQDEIATIYLIDFRQRRSKKKLKKNIVYRGKTEIISCERRETRKTA